jgi:tetratricopeptide (TPR) repeat protein
MPLTVSYVKQISSPDNIFRYELTISGDSIRVTRDDLKCHVKFTKHKQLTKEQLNEIEDSIRQSDFMNLQKLQPGVSADNVDEDKKLTVAFGKNLNSIRVKNTFEPQPFKDAVRSLEDFSETILNIPPVSLTAEEMKHEAEIAFDKAEQLFSNYQAQDENLSEAIKRYQLTVEYLEYFEPKPPMYDKAFSRMQEAKKILLEEIKAHNANAITYQKKNDWLKAKEEYRKIMAKLDPDDKRYQQAREKIIMIEKHYKMDKKK